ncbi:MAG: hypothetical protein KC543_16090 [Myxococcales bacterium]|nr:hypothetical protein [Myxococcales bacterium]
MAVAFAAAGCGSGSGDTKPGGGPGPTDAWAPAFDATNAGWVSSVFDVPGAGVCTVGGDDRLGCPPNDQGQSVDECPDEDKVLFSHGREYCNFKGAFKESQLGSEMSFANWGIGFNKATRVLVGRQGRIFYTQLGDKCEPGGVGSCRQCTIDEIDTVPGCFVRLFGVVGHPQPECQGPNQPLWCWPGDNVAKRSPLWGIWGPTPDDLWVVGGLGTSNPQGTPDDRRVDDSPVVIHYQDGEWNRVDLRQWFPGALDGDFGVRTGVRAFFKVWGTSANDVWIVGQGGILLHWDGNEFTAQTAGTSRDLISLWGTGPNHIVAVGGRANGVYAVWDGSSWTSHELQPLPGLNGVWMDKPNVAHAVGVAGTIVTIHLDTGEVVQEDSGTSRLEFHSVHGDRDNHTLYAVGGNFDKGNDDPYVGIVVQRKLGSDE